MASSDASSSWVLIRQGVRDTERLIGQKQYNLAMTKARQTLEYMVKTLAERYGIAYGDLIDTIDELYRSKAISKTTCEHYHKIHMIGNKASRDGDDNAYNANTAYHLLSQEVYTFADDSASPRKSRRQIPSSNRHSSAQKSTRDVPSGRPVRSSSSRQLSAGTIKKRKASADSLISPYTLLKLIIPILVVILLIAVIRMFTGGDGKKETMPETTQQITVAATAPPTTEAPTEAPVYITNSRLNVRSAPSTDGDLLTTLDKGTIVDYIREYDDTWSVINYEGGEAYVSTKYLTPTSDESTSSESESSESATDNTE